MKKRTGVLLPVSSLPSGYGIGKLGKAACEFIDFLSESGSSVWQVLPVGPTGYGDSPYQSLSSFAGNPYLIDFIAMAEDGFIGKSDIPAKTGGARVDYGELYTSVPLILGKAYEYSGAGLRRELDLFARKNPWAEEYALFAALKEHFGGKSWHEWDGDAKTRDPEGMEKYGELLSDRISYYLFTQYVFDIQWKRLLDYAGSKGVEILGDLPFYTAPDSADVWAHPELYELDEKLDPVLVAGVPPDYFSRTGQLWGNPLYRFTEHEKDGYGWWVSRIGRMAELYDMLRLDHFIGFVNYYSIPAGAENAVSGEWKDGPGYGLFREVKKNVPGLEIAAENLGIINDKVRALLSECGFPGMSVLQFAYSGDPSNPHLPENTPENSIMYTGTHDNPTCNGWWSGLTEEERARIGKTLCSKARSNIAPAMMKAALMSPADTVIIPMGDIMGLGGEARINTPGTPSGNWTWRLGKTPDYKKLSERLRKINLACGRTTTLL